MDQSVGFRYIGLRGRDISLKPREESLNGGVCTTVEVRSCKNVIATQSIADCSTTHSQDGHQDNVNVNFHNRRKVLF